MFGLGGNQAKTDRLGVQAYAVVSEQAFGLAQRLWNENGRNIRTDESTHKEFLHFGYTNPKSSVWLMRDQGRADAFELIIRWETNGLHEVFTLTRGQTAGNEPRALALLNSMLTTPSVVAA